MTRSFLARHAIGARVEAECLAARDGFSARYDLDRRAGVFSRPTHRLFGQPYDGRILVLDAAKGGVATAWMLHEMKARRLCPAGIVLNAVNPIIVQGAALADIPMLCGFEVDITAQIVSGQRLVLDPASRTLTIL